jgi:hypothetical protein
MEKRSSGTVYSFAINCPGNALEVAKIFVIVERDQFARVCPIFLSIAVHGRFHTARVAV